MHLEAQASLQLVEWRGVNGGQRAPHFPNHLQQEGTTSDGLGAPVSVGDTPTSVGDLRRTSASHRRLAGKRLAVNKRIPYRRHLRPTASNRGACRARQQASASSISRNSALIAVSFASCASSIARRPIRIAPPRAPYESYHSPVTAAMRPTPHQPLGHAPCAGAAL